MNNQNLIVKFIKQSFYKIRSQRIIAYIFRITLNNKFKLNKKFHKIINLSIRNKNN